MRERVGGKLNVRAIPSGEYNTKLSIMMVSADNLPDLLNVSSKFSIDSYALTGAYIPVDDNLDLLPNYLAFWDKIPEEERKERQMLRLSGDGKTYFPQIHGVERIQAHYAWLYRKDIFEKNNLTIPETWDELYELGLALKELYPNSFPFSINGYNVLAGIGPQWKPYFQHYVYYDFENEEWRFGATEQTMYDIVDFLRRCREAELIAPDFLTINKKGIDELISTDRGFIMINFVSLIDYYNQINRERDPDYTWALMEPPRGGDSGTRKVSQLTPSGAGYAVCNTGDKESIANAFRLIDWMYTDEATELLNWGKEGVTYTVEKGQRKYIADENENLRSKYGIFTAGTYQRVLPEASYQLYSEEQNEAVDLAMEYEEEQINPKFWIAFSDEEFTKREQIRPAVENYTDEMLSKFILGMEPLSKWDVFQKNLEDLGVEELLEVHRSAYKRAIDTIEKQ